ncbi:MAG TPA: hypothetical protein VJ935_07975, partial [Acidimicrobiia bacterium]|nr:hypothetical protein [Acidimicrobiia bacterium]
MSDRIPELGDHYPTAATVVTDPILNELWDDPPGLWGKLKAVQNDAIGKRLILTGFFFLILGGSVDSVVMRMQLAFPNNTLVSAQTYS